MKKSILLTSIVLASYLHAGEKNSDVAVAAISDKNNGDWCEWLADSPGTLYKNKENPWIQEITFGGRFHWQAAYIDGEGLNGAGYNDTYDDYRRARLEAKLKFLQYFQSKISVNMVSDQRFDNNDLDWGYQDFDVAVIGFDIKKAFDVEALDALELNYGRHKFAVAQELHMSSNEIYTIERSAIANKVGGGRPTGFTLYGEKGDYGLTLGYFSGTDGAECFSGFNDGDVYYASLEYKYSKKLDFIFDFTHNEPSGNSDFLGYEWATSLAAIYEDGPTGLMVNAIVGENNPNATDPEREGSFHGLVVTPWYWLKKDKLQAVARYQYQASENDEGIRVNSRYINSDHGTSLADVGNGRGDEHHSLYLGLNYYLCGDNAKIMLGAEYDNLSYQGNDAESMTYSGAFRVSF